MKTIYLIASLFITAASALAQLPPTFGNGGVVTASAFGGAPTITPGTWIEIYGNNLSATTREWTTADFKNGIAPTTLDGVKVTINGQQAFIRYVSPLQVNAQIPSNIGTGPMALVLSNANGSTGSYALVSNPTQPGLLAPANFNVNAKQYIAALFPDGVTFVAPVGSIPGVSSRPAKAGDTITMYGIGFGTVTPDSPAGQAAPSISSLTQPVQIFFGSTQVTNIPYAGLAPGYIGLYQFNVVVPEAGAVAPVPVKMSVGGNSVPMLVYTSLQ